MDLLSPLEPLTPRQRTIAITLALVSALSRFLARARTPWDWDEALFCLGMRSYDVAQHHPHPPGFPVYIAMGRAVRLLLHDDFRSLQAVNLAAGVLLFPAMFLLGRELRLRFDVAALAASLLVFLPNVWFFGGTAFSDVPSVVLVVAAIALLIRGCRDRRAYYAGVLLLAVSIGIRPQNLLVGLGPGVVASVCRFRRKPLDVAIAALLGIAVVGAAFGAAAAATGGYERYMSAVRDHGAYIARVDSFRNIDRPPLWRLVDRFFVKQYQSKALSLVTSLFVGISAIGAFRARDRRIGMIVLAFAPFAVSAWMMLDTFSISRFSIGYAPLFAVLAADGVDRAVRGRATATAVLGGALVLAFAIFAFPGLAIARRQASPSAEAIETARARLNPARDRLYVGTAMMPFAEYYLPDGNWTHLLDERGLPLDKPANGWLMAELDATSPRGLVFQRARSPLWDIARRHYFEVGLAPITRTPEFGEGWYGVESGQHSQSRWMSARSVMRLPSAGGPQVLRLIYELPSEVMQSPPVVTLRLNGKVLERLRPKSAAQDRVYVVRPALRQMRNVLEIEVDRTISPAREHPGGDPRDLGLMLRMLSWGAK